MLAVLLSLSAVATDYLPQLLENARGNVLENSCADRVQVCKLDWSWYSSVVLCQLMSMVYPPPAPRT